MQRGGFSSHASRLARKNAALDYAAPKSEPPPRSYARLLSLLVPLAVALGVLALLLLIFAPKPPIPLSEHSPALPETGTE